MKSLKKKKKKKKKKKESVELAGEDNNSNMLILNSYEMVNELKKIQQNFLWNLEILSYSID